MDFMNRHPVLWVLLALVVILTPYLIGAMLGLEPV